MTKTIYKYTLTHNVTEIDMPATGVVLTVQVQGDEVVLWALVDPKEITKRRRFLIISTGHKFTFDERVYPKYIGTIQMGSCVLHVFEEFN